MPELETGRLILRMFTPEDLDDLARIFSNREVMRYLGASGEPITRAETEYALMSIINHWHRHGIGRWAVEHKEERKLIGFGGLRWFEHEGEGEGRPELVYLLDEPYWRQGLATEIAHACLRFGFEERKFEQVVAMTKPGNVVSRYILERKLCMQYVGEKKLFDIDVVQYVISSAEYRSVGAPYFLRQRPDPSYMG